jgi:hypothetical protein
VLRRDVQHGEARGHTLKEPLAESIHERAPASQLLEAWKARQGTDYPTFVKAYESLLFALSLDRDARLASTAKRMQGTDLKDLWETRERSLQMGGGDYSPNLSAFSSILRDCEGQAQFLGIEEVDVVHDEQSQFAPAFSFWFRTFRESPEEQVRFPDGTEERRALRRLRSLVFSNSATEIGIQIADVLASAVRVAVQDVSQDNEKASRDIIPAIQRICGDENRVAGFPYVIGPPHWQDATLRMLLGKAGIANRAKQERARGRQK